MRPVDIIQKKRDNQELTKTEINEFLTEYLEGKVPDYQMSSFLMAVYFNGMNTDELVEFTEVMKNSGELIEFDKINRFLVDKHSTGGVGDKVTVSLAPILAALGMATTKLSGKGLGHTGGTIDKFESIDGFKFSISKDEVQKIAEKTGVGLMGSSDKVVPLDKQLYALRDVTATVPSIPLIASSIMSKKLAIESDAIILDVKYGSGAFMREFEDAKKLASTMIDIGKGLNRNIVAVLSNMDQPLGTAVGNSLEIIEGIDTLKGNGPEDFTKLVYTIASLALKLKGEVSTLEEGQKRVEEVVNSGKALDHFKMFIEESGGNPKIVDDYDLLPQAKNKEIYVAKQSGYISSVDAENVGKAAMVIGAGRETKEDNLDHAVGLKVLKKIGDYVEEGETLVEIYYNSDKRLKDSVDFLNKSFEYSNDKVSKIEIIKEILF